MAFVRRAAVAGAFYPAEPRQLEAAVASYLAAARPGGPVPKAIIAPHAGYVYSGPVAASVYARLLPAAGSVERVVLIGPSHRVPLRGLAVSTAAAFATPLGDVPLDREAVERLLALPQVAALDEAHAQEHSLEVHLPFLVRVLGRFRLVPIVAGDASAEAVAEVLDAVWGGPETLVVVSSDLSHYLDYDTARRVDRLTTRAIEALDAAAIGYDQACGRVPIGGLLAVARRRGMTVETVDLRNSGDTAGPRDHVVGYGAWAFVEPRAAKEPHAGTETADDNSLLRHGPTLRGLAHASIRRGLETGRPLTVRLADYPETLRARGAAFVTLRRGGSLRGCVGSPVAWRPLAEDVADNAFRAAFRDGRFPPLTAGEMDGLQVTISVLTPPQPVACSSEADLLRQLRCGTDGLIIADQGRRALFLPSVWETLPDPAQFLHHLRLKAGLPPGHWSDTFLAERFQAVELKGGMGD